MTKIFIKQKGEGIDNLSPVVSVANVVPTSAEKDNILISDGTGSIADSGIGINNIDAKMLGGKSADSYYNLGVPTKTIPSYTSLNNVTTLGHYYVDFSVAKTLTDLPPEIQGMSALFELVVGHISTNRIFQMIIKHENSVYYRTGQIDGTWNGWEHIIYASQVSNPNLLINGGMDINQRSTSAYTVSGETKYVCDGWKANAVYGTVTWNTDGSLTLTSGGNYVYVYQFIENYKELLNKPLTFSIDIDGVKYSASGTLTDTNTTFKYSGNGFVLWVVYQETKMYVQFYCNTDYTFTIDNAKLEVSTVATPYSPRPYGEELALCQRYYINSIKFGSGYCYNGTDCYIFVALPTKMRITPSVTVNSFGSTCIGSNFQTVSSINAVALHDNGVLLRLNRTNNGSGPCSWGDGDISLSAEL